MCKTQKARNSAFTVSLKSCFCRKPEVLLSPCVQILLRCLYTLRQRARRCGLRWGVTTKGRSDRLWQGEKTGNHGNEDLRSADAANSTFSCTREARKQEVSIFMCALTGVTLACCAQHHTSIRDMGEDLVPNASSELDRCTKSNSATYNLSHSRGRFTGGRSTFCNTRSALLGCDKLPYCSWGNETTVYP